MSITFWASLSVLVFVEVFVDTTLTEGIKALIYGVSISKKPCAERAF